MPAGVEAATGPRSPDRKTINQADQPWRNGADGTRQRRHRPPRRDSRHQWYGLGVPAPALTPAVRDQIARLGHADIMVGIPSFKNAATIGYVARAAQAGLVQYFPDLKPVLVNSD